MKRHRLIELARTERAIAVGLRSIEEQNEILEELERLGLEISLAMQALKALRQTQQVRVARRDQLLHELADNLVERS